MNIMMVRGTTEQGAALQACLPALLQGPEAGAERRGGRRRPWAARRVRQRAPVPELLGLGCRRAELGPQGWCRPTNDAARASGRRRLRGRLGCRGTR
uniref:Alternative protein LYNX1 n=1 Tax=Homo sapiens TaxID=9606 RepID=L8EB58_HUMAN|nr:alternative protein LYNX1 [Homo sapiens]